MASVVPKNNVGAITLFIEDPPRSKTFYANVFDVAPIYEDDDAVAFRFDNLIVNLLAVRAAPELVAPAPVAEPGAEAQFQLTIWVDDVDRVAAELDARGVPLLNGPVDREWGVRTVSFTDPDGHIWEVAHDLPATDG